MKFSSILLLCLLTSCGSSVAPPGKTGVVTPAITAPIKTAPVTASVARVSQAVDAIESRALSTTDAIESATKATDAAINQPSDSAATRAFLADISRALAAAKSSNGELLSELSTLKTERTTLQQDVGQLNDSIAAKETEVTALRQSLQQANQDLSTSAKAIDQLNKANVSLTEKSATAGVYRNWVIGGVVLLILVAALCLGLKTFRPL